MKRTSCFVFQTEPDLLNCGGTIGTIQCNVSCNAGVVLYVLQAILNRTSSVIKISFQVTLFLNSQTYFLDALKDTS